MTYDPLKHHRRSIRLQGYDYARAGAYFVSVVAQDRACLFGEVVEGVMRLNAAGQMVQTVWDELPAHYPGVDVDAFVVMPNHIHGIIVLAGPQDHAGMGADGVGAAPRGRPGGSDGNRAVENNVAGDDPMGEAEDRMQRPGQARGPAPTGMGMGTGATMARFALLSLPDVVQRLKSLTTTRYRHGVNQGLWPGFRKRVWQRNYYEEVIRDEAGLARIRRYIAENPLAWDLDEDNPHRAGQ